MIKDYYGESGYSKSDSVKLINLLKKTIVKSVIYIEKDYRTKKEPKGWLNTGGKVKCYTKSKKK